MLSRLGINVKAAKVFSLLSFLELILLWLFTAWRYRLSPDYIPLHYTVYFGFDRFGPKYDIFLFATIGTIILLVNLAVGTVMFRKEPLWQALWWALTALLELILIAALVLAVLKSLA
jgi:hypothetical protein